MASRTLLVIHIYNATDVSSADFFSKSDPYFICRIGSKGSSWEEKGKESQFEVKSQIINFNQ